MIREALDYLVGLGRKEVIVEEYGAKYTYKELNRLEAPVPACLKTNTLKSIVDYIRESFDYGSNQKYIINVCNYRKVDLLLPLNCDENRPQAIECMAPERENLNFGRFIDVTQFNIMLQSSFCDVLVKDINYKEIILKVVGNLGDGVVRNFGDDGVSQKTTIKAGVENLAEIKVPNPVVLAPYRTFSEVMQPNSKFIFRLDSGKEEPRAALFEADGGAWKVKAKENIIEYFKEQLGDMKNVHILG